MTGVPHDLLDASSVMLAGQAVTMDDAISEAGELLTTAQAVEPAYVDAMHEREKSVSTYMGNLLAIPHGTNEAKSMIKQTGISFVCYPEPIDWHGNPAQFVIGIAGAGDDHLEVLARIAEVFTDNEQVERRMQGGEIALDEGMLRRLQKTDEYAYARNLAENVQENRQSEERKFVLKDYLDPCAVSLGNEVKDWRAAIETSGRLLVDSEAAEEKYVAAMIRTTEELGPYIVIAPGVAIPHARPEDGAMRVGLSVAVLAEPVEFGSKENDPVDLVFGFSTTDSDAHMDLIQALADFIEKEENCRALRDAETVEEILAIVERSGVNA